MQLKSCIFQLGLTCHKHLIVWKRITVMILRKTSTHQDVQCCERKVPINCGYTVYKYNISSHRCERLINPNHPTCQRNHSYTFSVVMLTSWPTDEPLWLLLASLKSHAPIQWFCGVCSLVFMHESVNGAGGKHICCMLILCSSTCFLSFFSQVRKDVSSTNPMDARKEYSGIIRMMSSVLRIFFLSELIMNIIILCYLAKFITNNTNKSISFDCRRTAFSRPDDDSVLVCDNFSMRITSVYSIRYDTCRRCRRCRQQRQRRQHSWRWRWLCLCENTHVLRAPLPPRLAVRSTQNVQTRAHFSCVEGNDIY